MPREAKNSAPAARESAQVLALQGLAFLAEDTSRMLGFLKLTGFEPGDVRAQAGTPELSLAVLEHLAQDESLLLVFAASCAVAPASIGPAISLLRGQDA